MSVLAQHARGQHQDLVLTEGGRHTKVQIGDRRPVVPRHTEINERTARAILQQMGVSQ